MEEPRSGGLTPPLPREHFDLGSPRGAAHEDVVWVMHCAEGPVPLTAAAAVAEFMPREIKPWTLRWEKDFLAIPRQARRLAARVLGARSEDLTLNATTSTGLVAVAQGLPWREGDQVVTPLGEFPANAWPWKALAAHGVSVREVALWPGHRAGAEAWQSTPPPVSVEPEARLLAACGERTRLLALSWVRFQDGLRLDLQKLARGCKERGVHLVVDGIQGAGTLPIQLARLDGVSAFASGAHKGLLAPQGMGVLWTDAAFRAQLVPQGSWLSVEDATDFQRPSTDLARDWVAHGERLEAGVPNLVGCAAMRASLELIDRAGPSNIAEHVRTLQQELLSSLLQLPRWAAEARRLSGLLQSHRLGAILSLHHGVAGQESIERLLRAGYAQGIFASIREGYLRIALHGWHHRGDLRRLNQWLGE